MIKRLLAMVLALLMVLSVAAGCGKTEGNGTEQSTQTSSTADQTAPAEKKEIELKIGWANVDRVDKDEYGKFILDKFKIKVTAVGVDGDKLKMLATTNDLPDMFAGSVIDPFYVQLVKEGLIRDIPDTMLDKFPNLKTYATKSAPHEAVRKAQGKLYALPRLENTDNPPKAMTAGMYVRADWMKDLGKTMPTTTDEFYDLLKAFTTGDPDKNGVADTLGTSGWIWQIHFIPWLNVYGWMQEDGKWIPGYVSKELLPALKFWNKMYKEKILDPEFAVAKDKDMFYQGKLGAMFGNTGEYWLATNIGIKFGGANPAIADPYEAVQLVPPLKKDAASPQQWPGSFNTQSSLFGANCNDEKLERLLEYYEWSFTPEGRDFANYGFKDKDYIVKDGKAIMTLPMNQNNYGKMQFIWEVYPSIVFNQIVAWGIPPATPMMYPLMSEKATALDKKFHEEIYGPHTLPDTSAIDNLEVPSKATYTVGLGAIETELNRLISSDNVEEEFNKFKKNLLEVDGLQKVIDEVTAEVAAKGLDKK